MEVRERILQAALGLLAEGGARELTQPRVSKAAGVRQSHLTYYFPTRADLLQEVARYSIGKLAGQLAGDPVQSPAHVAEGIAAGAADKKRVRIMLALVAAAGLETDDESLAFLHSTIIGCAVLQLARDNAAARAEAKAVLRKAAACIAKGAP